MLRVIIFLLKKLKNKFQKLFQQLTPAQNSLLFLRQKRIKKKEDFVVKSLYDLLENS